MRSGAGAVCPRSRRLECLLDFFTRDLLASEAGRAELRVAFPAFGAAFGATFGVAAHAVPAVRSSARLAVIEVRSFIQPRSSKVRHLSDDYLSMLRPSIPQKVARRQ